MSYGNSRSYNGTLNRNRNKNKHCRRITYIKEALIRTNPSFFKTIILQIAENSLFYVHRAQLLDDCGVIKIFAIYDDFSFTFIRR